MTKAQIMKAIIEAKRFLEIAEQARVRLEMDSTAQFGSKETAAAKRASMDLSRVLAELRR